MKENSRQAQTNLAGEADFSTTKKFVILTKKYLEIWNKEEIFQQTHFSNHFLNKNVQLFQ